MTLHVSTYWCMRCHAPTLHDHDGEKRNCIPCAEKRDREKPVARNSAFQFVNDPSNTEAFLHALDGADYRGEKRPCPPKHN